MDSSLVHTMDISYKIHLSFEICTAKKSLPQYLSKIHELNNRIFIMASQSHYNSNTYGDVQCDSLNVDEYLDYMENVYGNAKELSQAEVCIIVYA